jgi:Ran GTPase-activating protein 1
MGRKPALEEFCAGRNRLEDMGAAALGHLFGEMKSLKKVALPQNRINAEGFMALFAGLEQNPDLQWIEVNDNCLSDESAFTSLSRTVGCLQYLSVLNIGDSLLGDAGALLLLLALHSSNPHLLQLNLQYNELKSEAVGEELVRLVLEKEDLELLNIKGNDFTFRTKDKIVEGLEKMERRELLAPWDSDDEEVEADNHEKSE